MLKAKIELVRTPQCKLDVARSGGLHGPREAAQDVFESSKVDARPRGPVNVGLNHVYVYFHVLHHGEDIVGRFIPNQAVTARPVPVGCCPECPVRASRRQSVVIKIDTTYAQLVKYWTGFLIQGF